MFLGVVLTVHLAMNGKVGAVIGNPRVGNALFWCIGAVMAIVIGLSGWQAGALSGLKQVNPMLLTAGAMGASLVFAIAWLIPQIGAGPMTLTLFAGQIISAWCFRTSGGWGLRSSRSASRRHWRIDHGGRRGTGHALGDG